MNSISIIDARLTFLLSALALACSSVDSPGIASQVTDSAGVSIVSIESSSGSPHEEWTVSPTPQLVLGEGGSGVDLFRVTSAVALPDGRIAVANGGTGQIIVFSEIGLILRSHGRTGEGPGEWKRPSISGLLGPDTLVVMDSEQRRVSFVHADTGFLTSYRVEAGLRSPATGRGMFANRTLVVGGGHSWGPASGEPTASGYNRPLTSYQVMDLQGRFVSELGRFPGAEFDITVIALPGGETSMSADLIPFAKLPSVSVGEDLFFVGTKETWEIKGVDPHGNLRTILRWDRDPEPVRSAHINALVRQELSDSGDPTREPEIRRKYANSYVPETMPAFSSLSVDSNLNLWVLRYRPPGVTERVYDVIGLAGRWVATVTLPPGNRLLQVCAEFVLTLHRDDLGVETVRRYPLRR